MHYPIQTLTFIEKKNNIQFLVNNIIFLNSSAAKMHFIFLLSQPWCCNKITIYRMDEDSLGFNPKLSTYYVTSYNVI